MSDSGPDDIQLDDYGVRIRRIAEAGQRRYRIRSLTLACPQKRVERDLLNSRIVGLFLESLVCGTFMVTYSLGTWSLLRRDHRVALSRRNKIIIGVNTLMLALAVVVSRYSVRAYGSC